jgi:large conductance mechanosensitive channel
LTNEEEMLVELKKIREALEKPAPPTPPKGLLNEFKDFISKYKIFGLAVAFIIATYLGLLVQSLVKDLLLPLIGLAFPNISDLSVFAVKAGSQTFGIGLFLVALITFVIVAVFVFVVVKVTKKWRIE